MITFIVSDEGDWIGLYNERGKLLDEGHSLDPKDVARKLGFEVAVIEWDEAKFNEYAGHCPSELPK